MTHEQIRDLQHNLNTFTDKYVDVPAIKADGEPGPHTRKRLVEVLYWLGYGKNRKKATVTGTYANRARRALLVRRLRHPHSRLYFTPEMLREGADRRERQRAHAKKAREEGPAFLNGIPVEPWFLPWVQKIKARGRWTGWLVSGKRTKAHCVELCLAMCGRVSCPGRCAGASSRHAEELPEDQHPGAMDVTDYVVFAQEARAVGAPFFNDLPSDRVHFSRDGH